MAVTTTPLGFKKPDGNELVRGGDNVIADNADKAEEVIAAIRGRLNVAEIKLAAGGGGGTGSGAPTVADPDNEGLYFLADTQPAAPVQPDPDNEGLYFVA